MHTKESYLIFKVKEYPSLTVQIRDGIQLNEHALNWLSDIADCLLEGGQEVLSVDALQSDHGYIQLLGKEISIESQLNKALSEVDKLITLLVQLLPSDPFVINIGIYKDINLYSVKANVLSLIGKYGRLTQNPKNTIASPMVANIIFQVEKLIQNSGLITENSGKRKRNDEKYEESNTSSSSVTSSSDESHKSEERSSKRKRSINSEVVDECSTDHNFIRIKEADFCRLLGLWEKAEAEKNSSRKVNAYVTWMLCWVKLFGQKKDGSPMKKAAFEKHVVYELIQIGSKEAGNCPQESFTIAMNYLRSVGGYRVWKSASFKEFKQYIDNHRFPQKSRLLLSPVFKGYKSLETIAQAPESHKSPRRIQRLVSRSSSTSPRGKTSSSVSPRGKIKPSLLMRYSGYTIFPESFSADLIKKFDSRGPVFLLKASLLLSRSHFFKHGWMCAEFEKNLYQHLEQYEDSVDVLDTLFTRVEGGDIQNFITLSALSFNVLKHLQTYDKDLLNKLLSLDSVLISSQSVWLKLSPDVARIILSKDTETRLKIINALNKSDKRVEISNDSQNVRLFTEALDKDAALAVWILQNLDQINELGLESFTENANFKVIEMLYAAKHFCTLEKISRCSLKMKNFIYDCFLNSASEFEFTLQCIEEGSLQSSSAIESIVSALTSKVKTVFIVGKDQLYNKLNSLVQKFSAQDYCSVLHDLLDSQYNKTEFAIGLPRVKEAQSLILCDIDSRGVCKTEIYKAFNSDATIDLLTNS